jgi:pimeloyl-ACP methyl ester carboxylesterase
MVLMHGLVVSSRRRASTLVRLAPHHRVYAPDLPSFGKNDKPPRSLRPRSPTSYPSGTQGRSGPCGAEWEAHARPRIRTCGKPFYAVRQEAPKALR